MLRLAIIGVGWAGERQVQAIRELDRKVEVVGLMDSDADFLAEKAAELGITRTFSDYQDTLADDDIDAVSICTPHHLHCPMALEATAAGKHILVEKPIAMTVEDATRMIEAADASGVRLYVAENLAYTPQSRFLREVVRSGQHIGELTGASLVAGFRAKNFGYPGRRAWLTRPEHGGTGTWMLHGVHTMAQLRYIFGEVATVYLQEHHASSFERMDIEGTMSGLLTLENGLHINLVQSCEILLPGNLGGYTIHGDAGSIRASKIGYEVFTGDNDLSPTIQPYLPEALSDYALEIEAFADTVAGIDVGTTTGRSERRSLAIVQAGYESVRTGQPVHLQERFGSI